MKERKPFLDAPGRNKKDLVSEYFEVGDRAKYIGGRGVATRIQAALIHKMDDEQRVKLLECILKFRKERLLKMVELNFSAKLIEIHKKQLGQWPVGLLMRLLEVKDAKGS